MSKNVSKTQIDKLGDRLRVGHVTDDDLKMLDVYRRSFGSCYEAVVETIRQKLHLDPTGRPAKSTTALVDKLRRESIRLTQVQDIAGCRVIVPNIMEQERVVQSLKTSFPGVSIVDRRTDPSYGYRAVHVIVPCEGNSIEIQVRTDLQHQWAELSEKFSDVIDPAIKYGGGDESALQLLSEMSTLVAEAEVADRRLTNFLARNEIRDDGLKQQLAELRRDLELGKRKIADMLQNNIVTLETRRKK